MEQVPALGDERILYYCAFCGGATGTRDHCPSKIFLDKPYPENLPVVAACEECNSGFSKDEEYLATLLSCVISGTSQPERVHRPKITKILQRSPKLRARIEKAKEEQGGSVIFNPESERVKKIIAKLAKGHALFELHENFFDEPSFVGVYPIPDFTAEQMLDFEHPIVPPIWPEVGSRAMQRLITGADGSTSNWIEVQPGRYRYHANPIGRAEIRIVIDEYLACVVQWSDA